MTPTEAGALLAKLSSVDQRRVTMEASDSWAAILDEDITLPDAWEAARQHYAEHPDTYLTPGHINAACRAMRRRRFDAAERDPEHVRMCPPPDLDPRGEIAWRKAYRRGIGDGLTPTEADAAACQHLGITRPAPGPAIDHDQVRRLIEDSPVKRPEDEEPSS